MHFLCQSCVIMRPTCTTVHCEWPLLIVVFFVFWDRPTKTWVPTRRLAAKRGAWPFYYECGYEEVTQRKTWVPTRRLAAKRGAWPPNETVTGVISGSHEYTGLT